MVRRGRGGIYSLIGFDGGVGLVGRGRKAAIEGLGKDDFERCDGVVACVVGAFEVPFALDLGASWSSVFEFGEIVVVQQLAEGFAHGCIRVFDDDVGVDTARVVKVCPEIDTFVSKLLKSLCISWPRSRTSGRDFVSRIGEEEESVVVFRPRYSRSSSIYRTLSSGLSR